MAFCRSTSLKYPLSVSVIEDVALGMSLSSISSRHLWTILQDNKKKTQSTGASGMFPIKYQNYIRICLLSTGTTGNEKCNAGLSFPQTQSKFRKC